MVIKNKRDERVTFESLQEGDVFLHHGEDIYMKTESTCCDDFGNYDNAVMLANGSLNYFEPDSMIQKIKCELVIE